jgi:hypothetical protein
MKRCSAISLSVGSNPVDMLIAIYKDDHDRQPAADIDQVAAGQRRASEKSRERVDYTGGKGVFRADSSKWPCATACRATCLMLANTS